MKKEVSPAVLIVVIVVALVILVGGGLLATGSLGGPKPVSPKELSPEELRDDDPPRRGQPGYRERTTDPAPQ